MMSSHHGCPEACERVDCIDGKCKCLVRVGWSARRIVLTGAFTLITTAMNHRWAARAEREQEMRSGQERLRGVFHEATSRRVVYEMTTSRSQQRTQRGHDQLGPGAAMARAFLQDVGHDLASLQAGHASSPPGICFLPP